MTKEKSDTIVNELIKFHASFRITIDPADNRIKALTPFLPMTSTELRRLAKIVEGQFLSIKRSGTKVNISVW